MLNKKSSNQEISTDSPHDPELEKLKGKILAFIENTFLIMIKVKIILI